MRAQKLQVLGDTDGKTRKTHAAPSCEQLSSESSSAASFDAPVQAVQHDEQEALRGRDAPGKAVKRLRTTQARDRELA